MRFAGIIYEDEYLQTWVLSVQTRHIPLIGPHVYNFLRWACGKLSGHEVSKTEWGYGGGGHGDVWCRWCNQIGQIPLAEMDKRFENARAVIWQMTRCDIKQTEWKP